MPGRNQPCSHIWPCSRWGLPSQPVTRLLVGSYIKGPKSPHLFTLTSRNEKGQMPNAERMPKSECQISQGASAIQDLTFFCHFSFGIFHFSRRYAFCCTFPILGSGEPGPWTVGVTHHRVLWSPDF